MIVVDLISGRQLQSQAIQRQDAVILGIFARGVVAHSALQGDGAESDTCLFVGCGGHGYFPSSLSVTEARSSSQLIAPKSTKSLR